MAPPRGRNISSRFGARTVESRVPRGWGIGGSVAGELSVLAHMFECMEAVWLEAMGGQQCADALVAEVARERASAARRLLLVGQWAVLHNGDSVEQRYGVGGRLLPGTEQARAYGGAGTPEVAEFAVHELALLLGVPERVAAGELGDVLDLGHRHPLLWARVGETAACDDPGGDPALAAGMVQAWQATYVARRVRHAGLSAEAARWVDARTAKDLGRQAWSRFQDTLEARIKAADPVLAERRRRAKEASRRVSVSRTSPEGMKSLTVLLPAAQIIVMRARIHQLALILKAPGNQPATGESTGERAAEQAIGRLEADAAFLLCTNPLDALQRLLEAARPHPPINDSTAGHDGAGQPDAGRDGVDQSAPGHDTAPGHDATPGHDTAPGQGAAPVPDDPAHLFDDRPVHDREGGPGPDEHRHRHRHRQPPPTDPPGAAGPDQPPRTHQPDPDPGQEPDPDADADHEPGRESDPPGARDPVPDLVADLVADLVPESAVHPSQREDTCPTCGHDPHRHHLSTHSPAQSPAQSPAHSPAHSPGLDLGGLRGLDEGRLRPSAVLYLHASELEFRGGTGVVRLDNDGTALTHAEAIDLLGHCQVRLTRVVDLNDHHPVDGYEVPDRLAEQVRLAYPTTVFPYSATSSRSHGVDLDHARPYRPASAGGEPGQTSLDNLAPLARSSHRVKTHGRGWATRHPAFGLHLWRTPHGYCFQHDPTGTTALGKMTHQEFTTFSHELAEHIAWDQDDPTPTHDTATA